MRLIDADALKSEMLSHAPIIVGDFYKILDFIDEAPTVDVQRAIKGIWLWDKDGNKFCSNCRTGTSRETNVSIALFGYCPYCGSDNRESE